MAHSSMAARMGGVTAVLMALVVAPLHAHAEIKLLSDFERPPSCGKITSDELPEIQQGKRPPHACPKSESEKVDDASWVSLRQRIATPLDADGTTGRKFFGMGYRLHFDDEIYYIQSMGFMPKIRADDVCHEEPFNNRPTYRCKEGQRYTRACHIAIYNRQFEEVGWHTVKINRSYPLFCNADRALGRLDAKHNDVLAVVQYFNVEDSSSIATKPSEIGRAWQRMTVRLKLKKMPDGRIDIEQDDGCLGNPNDVEEIPEARKAIARCEKATAKRVAELRRRHVRVSSARP